MQLAAPSMKRCLTIAINTTFHPDRRCTACAWASESIRYTSGLVLQPAGATAPTTAATVIIPAPLESIPLTSVPTWTAVNDLTSSDQAASSGSGSESTTARGSSGGTWVAGV